MDRALARQKLQEHKRMLKDTKDELQYLPSGATKDAIKAILPMLEADAEVMQAIIDGMG